MSSLKDDFRFAPIFGEILIPLLFPTMLADPLEDLDALKSTIEEVGVIEHPVVEHKLDGFPHCLIPQLQQVR